jgi:hypothetical protein
MSKNLSKRLIQTIHSKCTTEKNLIQRRCSGCEPVDLYVGILSVCVKELFLVEDIGVEPMTPSLQS